MGGGWWWTVMGRDVERSKAMITSGAGQLLAGGKWVPSAQVVAVLFFSPPPYHRVPGRYVCPNSASGFPTV